MPPNDGQVTIEDARLIFRNFTGREGQFNREGDRDFCVLLDPKLAAQLDEDGWNVKALRAREEGDPEQPYINVKVSYKGRPPRVVLMTSNGRTPLDESTIEMLDWADIQTADLVFRPYVWTVGDKTGTKAYLKSLFVKINEDPLEAKYGATDIPARAGATDDREPPG